MTLYRAFATVGGLTLISRILGFLRDILLARVFGTGFVADAFVVAFRFPNLFRRLFGEGAFNSAFVPLFARRLEGEGPSAAREFAEEAMAGLVFVLLLVSALCMLAMPWLMYGKQTEDDLRAMFSYVQTLKPVRHRVDNTLPATACPVCRGIHGGGDQNQAPKS
jgi:putative peptidoglycan lipid II flippase